MRSKMSENLRAFIVTIAVIDLLGVLVIVPESRETAF
jgi:Na+/H+ antiporter NhaA